jgi:hypothetical protein
MSTSNGTPDPEDPELWLGPGTPRPYDAFEPNGYFPPNRAQGNGVPMPYPGACPAPNPNVPYQPYFPEVYPSISAD